MSRRRRQVMTTPHTPGHHEGGTQHPHVRQGRREASVEVGCGMLPGGAAHVANARRRSSCGEGRGVVLGMPAVCVGTWPACENGGPDVRWEVDGGAGIVRARLRPWDRLLWGDESAQAGRGHTCVMRCGPHVVRARERGGELGRLGFRCALRGPPAIRSRPGCGKSPARGSKSRSSKI